VTRQWLRDGRVIAGADGRSHRVVDADRGTSLRCRVRVSGPGGRARSTSPPIAIAG